MTQSMIQSHSCNFAFSDDGDLYPPQRLNEPHVPVILLCDTSASMRGKPIQNLSRAISKFRDDLCKSKFAEIIDVCIMAFNDKVGIVQNWRPLTRMSDVEFEASGCTAMAQALECAVDELRSRGGEMVQAGIPVRLPQLVLITDAYSTEDVSEVAERIHSRTAAGLMQLWVLALNGYCQDTVFQLTGGKRALELLDEESYDYRDFFAMMSDVLKAVSQSAPGERIQIRNPLERPGTNLKLPDWDAFLND